MQAHSECCTESSAALQAGKQNKIPRTHTAPTTWASAPPRAAKTTVRPPEVPGRSNSLMLKRDSNSSSNTKARRKPNCAETSKCMDNANSATPAHTHTEHTSSKRRLTCQATSWPSFAHNSTPMACACMVRDANSCTVFMIWSQNWPILKHSAKEPDLLIRETLKSARTQEPSASGPTWRQVMAAEHQRGHVSHALSKFTTKTTCRKICKHCSKKMTMKEPKKASNKCKPSFNRLSNHLHSKPSPITIMYHIISKRHSVDFQSPLSLANKAGFSQCHLTLLPINKPFSDKYDLNLYQTNKPNWSKRLDSIWRYNYNAS